MHAYAIAEFGYFPFERLFCGCKQYPFAAFAFDCFPFGMFPDYGRYSVDAYFCGLFHEPFETVDVFGRAAGHMQYIAVSSPVGMAFFHYDAATFRRRVGYDALMHSPLPVDDIDDVSGTVPEHSDAMCGFVFIQAGRKPFCSRCFLRCPLPECFRIENFHVRVRFKIYGGKNTQKPRAMQML